MKFWTGWTGIPDTQLVFVRPTDIVDRVKRSFCARVRLDEGKRVFVRVTPASEPIEILPGPDLEERLHDAFFGDVGKDSYRGVRGQYMVGPDGRDYLTPPHPETPATRLRGELGLVIEFRWPDGRISVYKGDQLPGVGAAWFPG